MPKGTFVELKEYQLLFYFTKDETNKIWNYKPDITRSLGKTNPLNENDLEEF